MRIKTWIVDPRLAWALAVLLLATSRSEAATVTGNCDAGFSINAALAALDRVGPHTIEVVGTCREQVIIDQRDRVTIQGPAGGTATIVFPATGGTPVLGVVLIQRSRAILLRQLVIDGASRAQRGVLVAFGADAQILSSQINNNTGVGVFVTLNSLAALGGNQPALAVVLTNNGNQGAFATAESFLLVQGFTAIDDNGRGGVSVFGGGALVQGPGNTIRGNGALATPGGAGVLGQTSATINIAGTPSSPVLISGNAGPGLSAETNTTVGLANTTVTGNNESGVEVLRGAVANIGATPGATGPGPVSITGNGQADLACERTAVVILVSYPASISTIQCKRIEGDHGSRVHRDFKADKDED